MARLVVKSEGFRHQVIDLKLGLNRLGRSPGNDFQIEHVTVSAHHCEIVLGDGELLVRDCNSTNGTFVDNQPIREAKATTGQTVRLGDVELFVESAEVTVAIPKFDVPRPAPPVVRKDGSLLCPRHPQVQATHQCPFCKEILCDACVHRLRRRGGKLLKLCPLCSHQVELIGGEKKKKKSFFGLLQKTVKLPFFQNAQREE